VPVSRLQFRGKIGPGMKIIGGTLISIAVTLLLNWLFGKIMDKVIEGLLQKQLEDLRPKIEQDIKVQRVYMLNMAANGSATWVGVRLHTVVFTVMVPGAPEPTTMDTLPVLEYDGIFLSDKDVSRDEGTTYKVIGLTPANERRFIIGMKIEFTAEEVEYYRAIKKELEWYDQQLEKGMDVRDVGRLSIERNELIQQLNDAFAD
jgi:hypothetical protein